MVESCRYFVGKTERRIKKSNVYKKAREEPKTNKLHITNMERKITHKERKKKKHRKKKIFFLHELCIFSTTTITTSTTTYNSFWPSKQYVYHNTVSDFRLDLEAPQNWVVPGFESHSPHLQSFLPKKRATLLKPKLIHCDYTISLHPP